MTAPALPRVLRQAVEWQARGLRCPRGHCMEHDELPTSHHPDCPRAAVRDALRALEAAWPAVLAELGAQPAQPALPRALQELLETAAAVSASGQRFRGDAATIDLQRETWTRFVRAVVGARSLAELAALEAVTKRIDRGGDASETSYYAIGPKRSTRGEALADFRALGTPGAGEQGQEPEGLRAAVEAALCNCALRARQRDGIAPPDEEHADWPNDRCPVHDYLEPVLARLSRYRWESAAEVLRLRGALETISSWSPPDKEPIKACIGMVATADAALAQPASADAEALGELIGLPERWIKEAASWAEHFDHEPLNEDASERARCAGELRALLRRCGLILKEGHHG